MRAKRMRTIRQQLIEEPATLADRTANGAGADTEPARELALDEAAKNCEREAAEVDGLVDDVAYHLRKRAAAIRALSSPDHADAGKVEGDGWQELEQAARNLIANRFDTYKARNGKLCSIEGDDGEKCWIVSFDDMAELEAALPSAPSEGAE